MEQSEYQSLLMPGITDKVAYSGIEGAFAHIAAEKIFPQGELISYKNFGDAYQAVLDGTCAYAVLPVENSYAGEVGVVMDLMFEGPLHMAGMYAMQVSQNLLGVPGAKKEEIELVVSHPQALDQCAEYIKAHGMKTKEAVNTARAAKEVADAGDPKVAAIASLKTAQLYGLSVLEESINQSSINQTKFAVLTKKEMLRDNADVFSMMFTVKNEAGALARVIFEIGLHAINMRVIRSRPIKSTPWEYYFYVELEGKEDSEGVQNLLSKLESTCESVKILGYYKDVTLQ